MPTEQRPPSERKIRRGRQMGFGRKRSGAEVAAGPVADTQLAHRQAVGAPVYGPESADEPLPGSPAATRMRHRILARMRALRFGGTGRPAAETKGDRDLAGEIRDAGQAVLDDTVLDWHKRPTAWGKDNLNRVDRVVYKEPIGDSGTRAGYFKADPPPGSELPDSAQDFDLQNPRLAARAVLSSLLDRHLGTNVLSTEVFAHHRDPFTGRDELGVVSAEVAGRPLVRGRDSQVVDNTIDLRNERTQRGLSDLQVVDWLTGQRDRHGGNIIVDEQGRVHGIDNDLAWTQLDDPTFDDKNRGLPPIVHEDTAAAIERMSPDDLERLVTDGMPPGQRLEPQELAAAKTRLAKLQEHIQKNRDEVVVSAFDRQSTFTKAKSESRQHFGMPKATTYLGAHAALVQAILIEGASKTQSLADPGDDLWRWGDPGPLGLRPKRETAAEARQRIWDDWSARRDGERNRRASVADARGVFVESSRPPGAEGTTRPRAKSDADDAKVDIGALRRERDRVRAARDAAKPSAPSSAADASNRAAAEDDEEDDAFDETYDPDVDRDDGASEYEETHVGDEKDEVVRKDDGDGRHDGDRGDGDRERSASSGREDGDDRGAERSGDAETKGDEERLGTRHPGGRGVRKAFKRLVRAFGRSPERFQQLLAEMSWQREKLARKLSELRAKRRDEKHGSRFKSDADVVGWKPGKSRADQDGDENANVNRVDVVDLLTGIAGTEEKRGYFKGEPKTGADIPADAAKDPDFGFFDYGGKKGGFMTSQDESARTAARAVASYLLDQALGLGVIAPESYAEFHMAETTPALDERGQPIVDANGQPVMVDDVRFGNLSAQVPGRPITTEGGTREDNTIDFKNPDVQRGLADLQTMDFLTGQLDRHGGNIFVDDHGKVTGIDNDLAFGQGTPTGFESNLGLPPLMSRAAAEAVKKMTPEQLASVLGGAADGRGNGLMDGEVAAAAARLARLQQHVAELEATGGIVEAGGWDASTYERARSAQNWAEKKKTARMGQKLHGRFIPGSYLGRHVNRIQRILDGKAARDKHGKPGESVVDPSQSGDVHGDRAAVESLQRTWAASNMAVQPNPQSKREAEARAERHHAAAMEAEAARLKERAARAEAERQRRAAAGEARREESGRARSRSQGSATLEQLQAARSGRSGESDTAALEGDARPLVSGRPGRQPQMAAAHRKAPDGRAGFSLHGPSHAGSRPGMVNSQGRARASSSPVGSSRRPSKKKKN